MTVLRSKCCNRLDKTVAVTVNGIWDTDLKSGNFLASSKESQSIKGFGISTRSSVDSMENAVIVQSVSAINFFIRSFPFVIKIVYGIVAVHFYRSAIDTIGGVKMLQKNIKILRR